MGTKASVVLNFGRWGCFYFKMNSLILILTLVGTAVHATTDRQMDNFEFERLMDSLETEMGPVFRDAPPGFVKMPYNTNSCGGHKIISPEKASLQSCKDAAAALNLRWGYMIKVPGYPSGCISRRMHGFTDLVYLNLAKNGKKSGDRAPICFSAAEVTYEIGHENTNA